MNAERRKRIEAEQSRIADLITEIESIREAEQESLDNMPESLQNGERGERAQGAIESLDDAERTLTDTHDALMEAAQ